MHEKAVGLLIKMALDVPSETAVDTYLNECDDWEDGALRHARKRSRHAKNSSNSHRRSRDSGDDFEDGSVSDSDSDTVSLDSASPRHSSSRTGSVASRTKTAASTKGDVTGAGIYYDDTDEVASMYSNPHDANNASTSSARLYAAARARARLASSQARQKAHLGLSGPKVRVYTLTERQSLLSKALSCAQMTVMRLQSGVAADAAAAAATAVSGSAGALKSESLGDLILQLRERLEVAKMQSAMLTRVEATLMTTLERFAAAGGLSDDDEEIENNDEDVDAESGAGSRSSPVFGGRAPALVDRARRLQGEATRLRAARRVLLTRLLSMDPDLYRIAADCGMWDVCLQIFYHVREDRLVEHIEQLWGNVVRAEIAKAQETNSDWEEPTAEKVVALLREFANASALCPIRYLIQTLERLRFDYGRPDPLVRGFIVETMLAANVGVDTLCFTYTELLEAQAQAPLPELVLLCWSVVAVLKHVVVVIRQETEAMATSKRAAYLRGVAASLLQICPMAKLQTSAGARPVLEQLAMLERTLAVI